MVKRGSDLRGIETTPAVFPSVHPRNCSLGGNTQKKTAVLAREAMRISLCRQECSQGLEGWF